MNESIFKKIWIFLRTIPYWKLFYQKDYMLFLDDGRIPKDVFRWGNIHEYRSMKWVVVRNHNEFVRFVVRRYNNGGKFPKLISFDHDLGLEHMKYYFENGGHANPPDPLKANFTEKTGYDSAKWLAEFCRVNKLLLPRYKVHSQNTVGSTNIESYLENYKKHFE